LYFAKKSNFNIEWSLRVDINHWRSLFIASNWDFW